MVARHKNLNQLFFWHGSLSFFDEKNRNPIEEVRNYNFFVLETNLKKEHCFASAGETIFLLQMNLASSLKNACVQNENI